jgi:hypothetical protein
MRPSGSTRSAPPTPSCTNAHLRNRGLQRFNVCGLCKARAVLLWHALAHNLKRMMALNFAFAA